MASQPVLSLDDIVTRVQKIMEKGRETVNSVCSRCAEGTPFSAEAVRSCVRRRMGHPEKTHHQQLLSDESELCLVGLCRAFDSAKLPLSQKQLLDVMRACFIKDENWDGSMWFEGFL